LARYAIALCLFSVDLSHSVCHNPVFYKKRLKISSRENTARQPGCQMHARWVKLRFLTSPFYQYHFTADLLLKQPVKEF